MNNLALSWQRRIDEAFPHGVIVSEDSVDHGRTITMACPRPEVVGTRGLSPVVFLEFPAHDRNLSGEITSWEQLRETPHRVVRVTMSTGSAGPTRDERQLWSTNLSDAHAASLRDSRNASLQRSQEDAITPWDLT